MSALSFGRTITQITADFHDTPGFNPAVTSLCDIVELSGKVPTHRASVAHLRDRCHLLTLAIRDAFDSPSSAPDKLISVLEGSKSVIAQINSSKLYAAFLRHAKIKRELAACHGELDVCLSQCSLSSLRELQNWGDDFERAMRRDHAELVEMFKDMPRDEAPMNMNLDVRTSEVRKTMQSLQNRLGRTDDDQERKALGLKLYDLQRQTGELLPDLNLQQGEVVRHGSFPVGGNGRMDIWEGTYLGNELVKIKIIRSMHANQKTIHRFHREVKIWSQIWRADKGQYVLPFYGFCVNDGPYPYMVSPLHANGSAFEYVKSHPDVDHRNLISGIAKGIAVLHSCDPPVIHGDIKGDNIDIDTNGNPLLADFGLAKIVEDISGTPFTQSHSISESYRWFAPELCQGDATMTTSSDIYAYSMTVIELMTHRLPFAEILTSTEVVIEASRGRRPQRPADQDVIGRGMDDALWELLNKCWCTDPTGRLSIHQVLDGLSTSV